MEFLSPKPIGIKVSFTPKSNEDHNQNKWLEQGLFQKVVRKKIGVLEGCITYWENNCSVPQLHFMSAIIEFLGFIASKIYATSLSNQILLFRNQKGLSQNKLGKLISVDVSSIGSLKKGKRVPYLSNIEKLNILLSENENN